MKVLNYGSLNYDFVYQVDHMVRPGETLSSASLNTNCGGKGLNQSIALARAGAKVSHAGLVGEDGDGLVKMCQDNGIDFCHIAAVPGKSGHAIIQVNPEGENCILLFEGANGANTEGQISKVLADFEAGDVLLLQNEVNLLDSMIGAAYERGMQIVLNPSPFNDKVTQADLSKVTLFLMNEIEGKQMTGEEEPDRILDAMAENYPDSQVVLTLGKRGCIYSGKAGRQDCLSFSVKAVDTTAAGDTFTGYFISAWMADVPVEQALRRASAASALAVMKEGAAVSIPEAVEVEEFLASQR